MPFSRSYRPKTRAATCHRCGAVVSGGRFCSECGEKMPPGARFCPQCGARQ